MNTPIFNQDQYVDADSFNAAFGSVSGSMASGLAATFFPGLVAATTAVFSVSGFAVNVALAAPFGVVFGTGILANAHGTVSGSDTQNYSITFSGLVPVSGPSVTAYAVASYQEISQTPIAITGPPPGHPDYNPNFVPYTGYQNGIDSLAVSATTTAPDNVATFELFRTSLTSGSTGLVVQTQYQQRRAPTFVIQPVFPNGASVLSREKHNWITVAGTYNLPAAALSAGSVITATSNVVGSVSVNAVGADLIYTTNNNALIGQKTINVLPGASLMLTAAAGVWQVLASTNQRQLLTQSTTIYINASGGNDVTGNGTSGLPFATLQHAVSYTQATYDIGGQTLLFQAAGNFVSGVVVPGPWIGQLNNSSVIFNLANGSSVIPSNGIAFNATNAGAAFSVQSSGGAATIAAGGAGNTGIAINTSFGGQVALGSGLTYSGCGQALFSASGPGSVIIHLASFTIAGSGVNLWSMAGGGQIAANVPVTGAFTGPFAYSAVCRCEAGYGGFTTLSFTNTTGVSGTRYFVQNNGVINTGGQGANFFPGTVAGTVNLVGGVYGNGTGQYL